MLPRLSNMKIYTSHIDDFSESDLERICNTVPDKLIEKSLCVKKEHSKKESLLGRYILFCVASANGIDIDSILYGENGKPYIENYKLYFNISHSDGFVCCAVSDKEVGIDAEKIKTPSDRVLKKVLCENERKTIKDTDRDFIRYWTLKEAYLKYTGEGLSEELFSLDFSFFADKNNFSLYGVNFFVREHGDFYISICSEDSKVDFIPFINCEIKA